MELEIVFGVENLVAESAVVGEAAGEMNALNVLSVGQQKIYVSFLTRDFFCKGGHFP